MNLEELRDLETAPPLEFMAVEKETGRQITITELRFNWNTGKLSGVKGYKKGTIRNTAVRVEVNDTPWRRWNLSDCHICQSTGYTDSEGEKVFDGHIVRSFGIGIRVVCWHLGAWSFYDIRSESYPLSVDWTRSDTFTIIGHIHIPSEWPDEVREVLMK